MKGGSFAPKMGVYADVAQLVEHHLAKVGVAGSNPVVRSGNYRGNSVSAQTGIESAPLATRSHCPPFSLLGLRASGQTLPMLSP